MQDRARNLGTVEMLYDQFGKHFSEKGMEYPSYQTTARYVKYLMEIEEFLDAWAAARYVQNLRAEEVALGVSKILEDE